MSNSENLPSTNKPSIMDYIPESTRESLSPEQKKSLANYTQSIQYGVSGIAPMICQDEKCPYYQKCPLVRANIDRPKGEDCPVETAMQEVWMNQFMAALNATDEDMSIYDLLLTSDLTNYQLLESRATMELAMKPEIQRKVVTAVDPKSGTPIFKYEMNALIPFKEKLAKMKSSILKELIATRKAKSDDKSRLSQDRSSQAALLIERAQKLKEEEEKRTKDAEYEVKHESQAQETNDEHPESQSQANDSQIKE